MVYAIKDAIEGKSEAHRFFIRFGKGVFENRFILKWAKKINGSFEDVPAIILFISNLTDANYKGKIISKKNIDELLKECGFKIINKRKKNELIEYEVEGDIEKGILNKIYPNVYFLLLDINAEGVKFKCKKNLPKPSAKNIKINDKFYTLELKKFINEFKNEFLFDIKEEVKKIEVSHTIIVDEIIFPKGVDDYEKIRVEALRKGKIKRIIKLNGKELIKEYNFKI